MPAPSTTMSASSTAAPPLFSLARSVCDIMSLPCVPQHPVAILACNTTYYDVQGTIRGSRPSSAPVTSTDAHLQSAPVARAGRPPLVNAQTVTATYPWQLASAVSLRASHDRR